MSGKFQMFGDFTFFRPSQILPIYRIYIRGLSQVFLVMNYYLFVIGGLEPSNVQDGTNLSFHLSGMIADHRRHLGRNGKIETLWILQICPRSSQTIGISKISSFH